MAVEVDRAGFEGLLKSPLVVGIEEDILMKPLLAESVPLINADDVWAAGYTGEGQVVAVLDTGVDKNHPALVGKVVSEACYSTTSTTSNPPTTSICLGGVSATTDQDSALPYISNCPSGECDHGTHVAGIVAGNNSTMKGVAKDADLIAIQVFSRIDSSNIASWSTDQIKGLERVYDLSSTYDIAAVNLSLGGSSTYSVACDAQNTAYKASVDKLRTAGIVTVAASGNDSVINGISSPACISTVVSVGATTDYLPEYVASFSNSASILDLLAPGEWITSSVPGTGYATWGGTSMATPHVTGAWALIRSAVQGATIAEILDAFKNTGVQITDFRNGRIKPRIDAFAAMQEFLLPAIPTNVVASDGSFSEKVTITWDLAANATSYQILRNTSDSSIGAVILEGNRETGTYDDTSGEPGTLYYYWVKGCNDSNCSDYSMSDAGWRSGLYAPTGVTASDGTFSDKVQINWNGIGDADYYKVFRNSIDSTVGAVPISGNLTTTSYDDLTVQAGSDYYYFLQACKTAGNECSGYSVSDLGNLQDDFKIYLPLLLKNFESDPDPILNGDFENGPDGSWLIYSSLFMRVIIDDDLSPAYPHSGNWYVWFGGANGEIWRLSQDVAISTGRPYLRFWVWIDSDDETCGTDNLFLYINDNLFGYLQLCTATNTGGWVEIEADLTPYAGDIIVLEFEVTTSVSWGSIVLMDDVSMYETSFVDDTAKYSTDGLSSNLIIVTESKTK
jgi:subtilisin family serine protease